MRVVREGHSYHESLTFLLVGGRPRLPPRHAKQNGARLDGRAVEARSVSDGGPHPSLTLRALIKLNQLRQFVERRGIV